MTIARLQTAADDAFDRWLVADDATPVEREQLRRAAEAARKKYEAAAGIKRRKPGSGAANKAMIYLGGKRWIHWSKMHVS